MTEYERLTDCVISSDILLIKSGFPASAASGRAGGCYAIAINERAFETFAERRVALAHEFGHCRTGAFCTERNYTINYGRAENRAWTSTVFNELPLDVLVDAVQRAGGSLFEVAEELNFTQEFVERAIEVYRRKGLWSA